jgi:ornithine cyclodeaminase/alanine dehydrogenase-like protein (mu-crystallin family)
VAKYVALDINRTAVPSLVGTDELLETSADDRTVRRIGSGVQAGSYVSSAANVLSPATYGNTIAIGATTQEYVRGLRARRR